MGFGDSSLHSKALRALVVAAANSRVWSWRFSPIGKLGWIVGTTRDTWVMSLDPIEASGAW